MATAVIVHYMVNGTIWVESRLQMHPQVLIAFGLLLAVVTGLGAWLAAQPFLSARSAHFTVPVIGEVHVSSTLAFDLGVYLLVIGSTILIVIALAHQSLRSPRKTAARSAEEPQRPVHIETSI
jgi:multicomponent K+:H+ antiporter subunit A